jgi:hypothetical protein
MRIGWLAITVLIALALPAAARGSEESDLCKIGTLPAAIQSLIAQKFPSWRVQERNDLSASSRGRWAEKKPEACPGIAIGKFKGPENAYAILLVPTMHPDAGYRFLVFSRNGDGSYVETLVESWDHGGAMNFFVRAVPIKKYFNAAWRKQVHASAEDGIFFADAGTKEYEVDVYYWSDEKFHHQWIDE